VQSYIRSAVLVFRILALALAVVGAPRVLPVGAGAAPPAVSLIVPTTTRVWASGSWAGQPPELLNLMPPEPRNCCYTRIIAALTTTTVANAPPTCAMSIMERLSRRAPVSSGIDATLHVVTGCLHHLLARLVVA